jgi:hypothetical protein
MHPVNTPQRLIAVAVVLCAAAAPLHSAIARENRMNHQIQGPFDVKLLPQEDANDPSGIARLLLDKAFHGELEATSRGQMLGMRTANNTSGGYVAMEKVTGTLGGKQGTFHLMHYGVGRRGTNTLTLEVVPDSGTGALEGLSGSMRIVIKDGGAHFYEFDYGFEGEK